MSHFTVINRNYKCTEKLCRTDLILDLHSDFTGTKSSDFESSYLYKPIVIFDGNSYTFLTNKPHWIQHVIRTKPRAISCIVLDEDLENDELEFIRIFLNLFDVNVSNRKPQEALRAAMLNKLFFSEVLERFELSEKRNNIAMFMKFVYGIFSPSQITIDRVREKVHLGFDSETEEIWNKHALKCNGKDYSLLIKQFQKIFGRKLKHKYFKRFKDKIIDPDTDINKFYVEVTDFVDKKILILEKEGEKEKK